VTRIAAGRWPPPQPAPRQAGPPSSVFRQIRTAVGAALTFPLRVGAMPVPGLFLVRGGR
jgi:hypothetical protein